MPSKKTDLDWLRVLERDEPEEAPVQPVACKHRTLCMTRCQRRCAGRCAGAGPGPRRPGVVEIHTGVELVCAGRRAMNLVSV